MSHTTKINSIVIKDIPALKAAIKELNREGVNCTLKQNVKPRAPLLFSAEADSMGITDWVIELKDSNTDVGLYYNKEIGGYEARTDFFGGGITRNLGNPIPSTTLDNETHNRYSLGKLYQTYAVCATERNAKSKGYMVQRSKLEDGTVQLKLTA